MSSDQVKQFLDEAMQSIQGGQFEQALNLAEQAIAIDDMNSEAMVLKGIALSQLQRAEDATEAFRAAIMASPYNPKAYFNLAVHQYQLGNKISAEEMARETVKVDPSHAGAKDLLNRIESERAPAPPPAGASRSSYPGDPLAEQPASGGSEPSSHAPSGPTETPVQSPYGGAPSAPGPVGAPGPTPTGYYRPGYETSNVHSLQFVGNMGKTWDTIGLILALLSVGVWVLSFVVNFGIIMEAFANPQAFQNNMAVAGNPILSILGYIVWFASLIWFVLELVDRRGNWLWFLPFFICCCCQLQGIVMAIYIWKGRS